MKIIKLFAALSVVAMLGLGFSSCGDDDNPAESSKEQGSGNQGGGGNEGDSFMTKAEQTTLLESTAREFIAMAPASDFKELATMFKEVQQLKAKNVENWAEGIFDNAITTLGDPKLIYSYTDYDYEYYSYERRFKSAFVLANYKGHFEVQNGKWILVDSNVDDLKFTFKDSNNAVWVLRAETNGPYKNVHMFDLHNSHYESSYVDNKYVSKYYYDYEECVIAIPKTLNVTLTKDNNQMVKTSVNAELNDITGEEFDISKNDISASMDIEVKDYRINVSQVVYKPNSTAAVNMTIAKGSTQMLSVAISSDLSGIPSVNVSAFGHIDSDTWRNTEGNALLKIDILGKVQIQGKATKIHAIADKLEAARKNRESESDFKSNINDANDYLDLGLYFNNKSLKQATAYLETFEKTGYRYTYSYGHQSYKYWGWDMVIKFGDDSSYSTMANYFNRSNFRGVFGDVESLIENYSKLVKK